MIPVAARIAVFLAPSLLVFNVIASFAGQHFVSPSPRWDELGFAACNLPCWAGITPGQTPFAEANELIAEYLADVNIHFYLTRAAMTFQAGTGDSAFGGVFYYDGSRVTEIHLDMALPVRDLLDKLGTPDCVWAARGSQQIPLTIYWERNHLSIGAFLNFDGRMAWTPNMRTRSLLMGTTLPCNTPGMLPWMGFAPAWRYEALKTE